MDQNGAAIRMRAGGPESGWIGVATEASATDVPDADHQALPTTESFGRISRCERRRAITA